MIARFIRAITPKCSELPIEVRNFQEVKKVAHHERKNEMESLISNENKRKRPSLSIKNKEVAFEYLKMYSPSPKKARIDKKEQKRNGPYKVPVASLPPIQSPEAGEYLDDNLDFDLNCFTPKKTRYTKI